MPSAKTFTSTLLALAALGAALPSQSHARPCSDRTPFVVNGVGLALYVEEPPGGPSCRTARRVVRRYLTTGRSPDGWRCRNGRVYKRCTRGGTFIDKYGNRRWRNLAGWHGLD